MSRLVLCASCSAAVPEGRFCTICGATLAALAQVATAEGGHSPFPFPQMPPPPAVPATAPGLLLLPAPAGGPPPFEPSPGGDPGMGRATRRARDPRTVGATGIGVLVLAVAGYLVTHVGQGHDLTGDLSVFANYYYDDLAAGDPCRGEGGYSDVDEGTQVVVEDESGATLRVAPLGAGRFDGQSCVFSFALPDLPPAEYYRVSAGGQQRGGVRYSRDELAQRSWDVQLTLGD